MEESESNNHSDQMVNDVPTIELFAKASPADPDLKGPCPICQKWFMVFVTMNDNSMLNLRYTPIDIKNPTKEYLELDIGRNLPVVYVHRGFDPRTGDDITGLTCDNDDEIESLMERFKCPGMELGASAFKVTEDLFRNFNKFLQSNNSSHLLANLSALNDFINGRDSKFLQGDEISFVDCVVMPKLQHIRVACKEFKNFDIPVEFTGLWKYFTTMYSTNVFMLSCPTDRDILIHYNEKIKASNRSAGFLLRDDSITHSVPE